MKEPLTEKMKDVAHFDELKPSSNRAATLVLASSSPRRKELLGTLGIPFEICASDVDESFPEHLAPQDVVEELAFRKAFEVYKKYRNDPYPRMIIGSDTIVVLEDAILGKPKNAEEAFAMLKRLQGRTHKVYTGVALVDAHSGEKLVAHRMTAVSMKAMTPSQIKRYVATGEPLDKAGAYAIQGIGATLVEHIEGCYFNVVGLPLALLSEMLAEFGMEVL